MKKTVYSGTTVRDARIPQAVNLTGWRFYGFVGVLVGTLGLTLYPILIDPILNIDKYSK